MAYFHLTRLALKWAVTRPVTSQYPFEPRQPLPGSRGELEFAPANCTYCTVCAKKCPTRAIGVKRADKTWSIDRLLCIRCGYCVESCPKHCLELTTSHGVPALTKDRECHGPGEPRGGEMKPLRP